MRTLTRSCGPGTIPKVGQVRNLDEVRAALVARLADEGKLSLLNARLILRTGVNLMQPKPAQIHDSARVSKVLLALHEMGFDF